MQVKQYVTHFPVKSYLEAQILSKESTWKIMVYIIKSGAVGVTADDIVRDLKLPPSMVYSTLKELRRLDFIFIYPRERKKKQERRKRYVCEKRTWGKYGIDKEFEVALDVEDIMNYFLIELKEPIIKVLESVYREFNQKKQLRRFVPIKEPSNICPNCNRSHEAMEFFYAILMRFIDTFISESEEFKEFLMREGYAEEEIRTEALQ